VQLPWFRYLTVHSRSPLPKIATTFKVLLAAGVLAMLSRRNRHRPA
jgi:hypothetical protein